MERMGRKYNWSGCRDLNAGPLEPHSSEDQRTVFVCVLLSVHKVDYAGVFLR